ncbi:transcriptional regulator GlxA family with amidase domain [Rhizobium sp. BK313]|uniref:helix-turn-helix domain-containing protein n=1 Tax=Rhizobium sp. BK313 TaxID=2587081 RepID=UPI001060B5F3|nr:AraC family transcriptional regulator [Rhizobium sp. BK313]MBB3452498.1 transcriptional regulator GlxA family with amidase domain [Rhizobium sp. BK313]
MQTTLDSRAGRVCGAEHFAASILALLERAVREIEHDREVAKAVIARASTLLKIEAERQLAKDDHPSGQGMLTAWQGRRVAAHIEANLADPIRIEALGDLVHLSVAHFSRAFKRSFGQSPHAYLVGRRLQHAQHLMLTTDAALCDIALASGFADQAHLCKRFRKDIGESPAAWRRERRQSPVDAVAA